MSQVLSDYGYMSPVLSDYGYMSPVLTKLVVNLPCSRTLLPLV